MKTRVIIFIFVALLAGLVFTAALAQEEGGSDLPQEYNWCNDANYWGDGRCNNTEDEGLRACLWEMGWWLPRIEAGEYTLEQVAAVSGCVQITTEPVSGAINIPACEDGYYIVVLVGSPYSGSDADETVSSDNFTAASSYGCTLVIHGNDNNNTITGSAGDDVIYGYGGNDVIYGDSVTGLGSGNDTIDGGAGDDAIYGDSSIGAGSGADTIDGGAGDDFIYGDSYGGDGSGADAIDGGDGDDTIYGDSVTGLGSGNDTIDGGTGNDDILGDSSTGDGSGNDTIYGDDGDDSLYGDSATGAGSGNDTIDGGAGTDTAYGDTEFGSASAASTDTCTNVEAGTCNQP